MTAIGKICLVEETGFFSVNVD
jgi:hypothetical protein